MSDKRDKACAAEREVQWQAMIEEATVDCYDKTEAFWGMFTTLEDRLAFPFEARVMGETVEVVGLDGEKSGALRGVVAQVRRGDRQYTVALADLEAVKEGSETAESLAAYRYWLGR